MEKIERARVQIILKSPFFAHLLLYIRCKPSKKIQTVATDGKFIYYNEKFIEKLTDLEVQGVLVHELLHCALLHLERCGERDSFRWNIACDFAVNSIILESGKFSLPCNTLYNPEFSGMTADEIYNRVKVKKYRTFPSWDSHKLWKKDEESTARWKVICSRALERGDVPSNIKRIFKDALKPKLNWREVLRNFVISSKSDYTFSPPDRRFIGKEFYIPDLNEKEKVKIIVAVDTSGSISEEQLGQFLAEVKSIVRSYQIDGYLLTCDAKIHDVYSLNCNFDVKVHGGGGTDFIPVFEWTEKNFYPDVLVYLTDGYGTYPENPPSYPVLWVLTEEGETPSFGKYVRISKV